MPLPSTAHPFERTPYHEAERSRESRESKENEHDPDAATASRLERADFLVKEVKNSKQQMQNILVHIGQVQQAITAIRKQLQLNDDGTATSLERDAEQAEKLQSQIAEFQKELQHMRHDLIREHMRVLKEQAPDTDDAQLQSRATQMVDALLGDMHTP